MQARITLTLEFDQWNPMAERIFRRKLLKLKTPKIPKAVEYITSSWWTLSAFKLSIIGIGFRVVHQPTGTINLHR